MSRNIILKKVLEDGSIKGFFIDENKKTTTIKEVESKNLRSVKYLDKTELKGQQADDFIQDHSEYSVVTDKSTIYNALKSGFKIVNNITGDIIGNYNY